MIYSHRRVKRHTKTYAVSCVFERRINLLIGRNGPLLNIIKIKYFNYIAKDTFKNWVSPGKKKPQSFLTTVFPE